MADVMLAGPGVGAPRAHALSGFVRNRYFYGKLLDVHHLELEQRYLNEKRWLINRLALGTGVLCGLELRAARGGIVIAPGVAIDGLGREIVVPEPHAIRDPFALTDESGRPTGERADAVTILLCFHECGVEPAPVLVSDCEVREECTYGAVRERFRVVVREGVRRPRPAIDCEALRAGNLCEAVDHGCAPPEEPCVPIGAVGVADGEDDVRVADCEARVQLYSSRALLEMLRCCCAGDRPDVGASAGNRKFVYEAGDGGALSPGKELRFAARLLEADDTPVEGETVALQVRAGPGEIESDGVSGDAGLVAGTWRPGDREGLHTLEVTEPAGARIVFHALVRSEP
jgi:hypothetical protein